MFWPDRGSGVPAEPARRPVSSAVRQYFTEGGEGAPPTVPGGDWFNQITNEMLNVLAAAGIDPSKTDDDQLLQAIQTLSIAGLTLEGVLEEAPSWDDVPAYKDGGPGGQMNEQAQVLLNQIMFMRNQTLSVKDVRFAGGAKGDGVTDDSASIQAALTEAGLLGADLYFPAGTYVINSTCYISTQSISIHGAWANTVLKGSAPSILKLPVVSGGVYEISCLSFEYDNIAIDAKKIWTPAGVEPSCIVSDCRFISKAINSVGIELSGIWACRIYGNSFVGISKGSGEVAIHIVNGDDMNTSVMNTDIQNNSTVFIAYPVKYIGRTLSSGGRVEGLSIIGNKFVAGKTGIWLSQTLATCISGNMCSDFDDFAIDLFGDFDFTIVGNMDLSGAIASIRLNELAGSILERGVITGNKISLKASTGGILLNAPNGGVLRGIAICGNIIGRSQTGTKAAYGIKYIGVGIDNISITGNVFMYMVKAVDRNGDIGSSTINGNVYSAVDDTGVSSPHNTPFTASILETMVGGASHTLTVPLPAGAARDRPFFASCILSSTLGGSPLLASYRYDVSTKDQVIFTIVRSDGTALPSGTVRFAIAALLF